MAFPHVLGSGVIVFGIALGAVAFAGCAASERQSAGSDASTRGASSESSRSPASRPEPANLTLHPTDSHTRSAPTRQLAVRITDPALADEFNNIFAVGDLYLAGWPTEQGLRRIAARGVKRIIALKTPDEVMHARGYDLQDVAKRLGMELIVLPIGPDTYSPADVEAFTKALNGREGPVLVHCGSASTSAMVWSGYLATQPGATAEKVMAEARAAGLLDGPMTEAAERVANEVIPARSAAREPSPRIPLKPAAAAEK